MFGRKQYSSHDQNIYEESPLYRTQIPNGEDTPPVEVSTLGTKQTLPENAPLGADDC